MIDLSLRTKTKTEFVDITSQIEQVVKKSGVKEGVCVVFCPHTTAALTINENADFSVRIDIIEHLGEMVPLKKTYRHLEGNSDSHIKSSLFGASLTLIIENGNLVLGTWQGIYFCEFDGPRTRKIHIKVVKD